MCLSSLQSSYPPLSHSVKFLGMPWGSPFLHCARHFGCPPNAQTCPDLSPSSPTGTLSMPTPLTLHTLYMLAPYGFFPPHSFHITINSPVSTVGRQAEMRYFVVMLHAANSFDLWTITDPNVALPAQYLSFIYSLFSFFFLIWFCLNRKYLWIYA